MNCLADTAAGMGQSRQIDDVRAMSAMPRIDNELASR